MARKIHYLSDKSNSLKQVSMGSLNWNRNSSGTRWTSIVNMTCNNT